MWHGPFTGRWKCGKTQPMSHCATTFDLFLNNYILNNNVLEVIQYKIQNSHALQFSTHVKCLLQVLNSLTTLKWWQSCILLSQLLFLLSDQRLDFTLKQVKSQRADIGKTAQSRFKSAVMTPWNLTLDRSVKVWTAAGSSGSKRSTSLSALTLFVHVNSDGGNKRFFFLGSR